MARIVTTSSRSRKSGARWPVYVLAVVLIVIAAFAVIRFRGNAGTEPDVAETVKPAAKPVKTTTVTAKKPVTQSNVREIADVAKGEGTVAVSVAPASVNNAIQEVPVVEAAESTNSEEEVKEEPPPKHFPKASEQLLAMMLSTPPDCQMPPLPHLDPEDEKLNADAIAAVTNDLVIYDNDSKKLEKLKINVADAKFQLAEVIQNGGNVAEALNELRNYQNEGVQIRNETIKSINAIEDDQAAAETFEKANEELKKENILPIRPSEVGMVVIGEDGKEVEEKDEDAEDEAE